MSCATVEAIPVLQHKYTAGTATYSIYMYHSLSVEFRPTTGYKTANQSINVKSTKTTEGAQQVIPYMVYGIAWIARRPVQSPCLSFRRSCVFIVAVDETIVNAMNDITKRRASPRCNDNDQHPLSNNEGFSGRLKLPAWVTGNKARRKRKTETKKIASKRLQDTSQSGFYCRTAYSNAGRTRQTCGVPV